MTANGFICDFKTGDGDGLYEKLVGYFQNREDCFKECLTMKKIKENINGVTWFPTGATRGCWCEISMTKIEATSVYTSCFIETSKLCLIHAFVVNGKKTLAEHFLRVCNTSSNRINKYKKLKRNENQFSRANYNGQSTINDR